MAMDFSGGAGAATAFDLIPTGQVAWAILSIKGGDENGVTPSKNSDAAYIDLELTLCDGQPFARRKIYDKIGHPFHPGNSENYRQMGMVAITRILEAAFGAGPNNPAGYQLSSFRQLEGAKVAIKVGMEKGTDGNPDRNRVREFLTPNPASQSGHKGWQDLMAGKYAPPSTAAPTTVGVGFGGQQMATGGNGVPPGFGGGMSGHNAATLGGMQQAPAQGFGGNAPMQQQGMGAPGFPPAGQAPQQGFPGAPAAPSQSAQQAASTMTSHSDPNAASGWLAQAQGQQ